ncbi:unnamed protein product [Cylicostephanus goldi]|uniref:Uncharacterized protein n=1 Tax=Cylicostephanus goldi TaxID=71465 RepID=A0A3P6R3M8_CYLGO|nr:unnamed protein product [Cylicostephanus goldi]
MRTTIVEPSIVPELAVLTNLRISKEKQPSLTHRCATMRNVDAVQEAGGRSATEGILVSGTNSPYFKRTISFRMVHKLYIFPYKFFLYVVPTVVCDLGACGE